MPCCGPWRARHVCGHVLWPILLVCVANVMWITTPLAGPLLPSDKVRNIIQQVVIPIVGFGITTMVYKVAIGAKWQAARTKKGVKLVDLMVRTGCKEFFRATGYRERLAYILLVLASLSHLLINIGDQGNILVPGYTQGISGSVNTPGGDADATLYASWWDGSGYLSQPDNLAEYLEEANLHYEHLSFSSTLLAYSSYNASSYTLEGHSKPTINALAMNNLTSSGSAIPALEVTIPSVLITGQNFDVSPDIFDIDTVYWQHYASNTTKDGRFSVTAGISDFSEVGIKSAAMHYKNVPLEGFAICISPLGKDADGVAYTDADIACVIMLYHRVIAAVAYDRNARILGSSIKGPQTSFASYNVSAIDLDSFGNLLPGWNQQAAVQLISSTMYNEMTNDENEDVYPAKVGLYRPASHFSVEGIAGYVAASTFIILALCGLLLLLNPQEALEPVGLLAVSRWPAELASEFYGEKASLSKAGKKRVFLHQGGPEGWVLSTQPALPSPGAFTPSPSPSAESGWKVTHSSSATKRPSMYKRQSSGSYQRQSGSYFAKRPSSHSPRPSYTSPRPSYHSRPSYQSRPSHHSTRPTSQSRPSYSSRPSYQTRESYSSNRPRDSSQRERERGHMSLNMPSHREMPEMTERRLTR